MSDAITAHGALVARAPTATPTQFTTIAELADITPPPLTTPSTEVTPHNDNIDAYVVGVRKRGELALVLNFLGTEGTHDEQTGLILAWADQTKDGYKLTFKDGTIWLMSGFVTNFAPVTPAREGAQTANVTIRPTDSMLIEALAIT